MKTKFTHWRWAMLAGACFMWACQEPSKQETKKEEPIVEQVKPTAEPVSAPSVGEPIKQEATQPETKTEPVQVKKAEERKPIVKTEKTKKETKKEEVVVIADQPAEPVSGYPSYYRYIKASLQYPEEAKKHNAEGQVFVEFIVRPDGSLDDVRVQPGKGIGYGCDEEAIRVIKQGEKWKPAINKGEPVAQRVTLPIKFKLN